MRIKEHFVLSSIFYSGEDVVCIILVINFINQLKTRITNDQSVMSDVDIGLTNMATNHI